MKNIFFYLLCMNLLINNTTQTQERNIFELPLLMVSGAALTTIPHILNSCHKTLLKIQSTQNLLTLFYNNLKNFSDIKQEVIIGVGLCAFNAWWYYKNTLYKLVYVCPKVGLQNFNGTDVVYQKDGVSFLDPSSNSVLYALAEGESVIDGSFRIIVMDQIFSFEIKKNTARWLYICNDTKLSKIDITKKTWMLSNSAHHIFVSSNNNVAVYKTYEFNDTGNFTINTIDTVSPIATIEKRYFNSSMQHATHILFLNDVVIYSEGNKITLHSLQSNNNDFSYEIQDNRAVVRTIILQDDKIRVTYIIQSLFGDRSSDGMIDTSEPKEYTICLKSDTLEIINQHDEIVNSTPRESKIYRVVSDKY